MTQTGWLAFILLIILANSAVFGLLFYSFRLPRAFDVKSRFSAAVLAGTALIYAECYVLLAPRFTASDLLIGVLGSVVIFWPFLLLGLFALSYFWAAFRGRKLVSNAAVYVLCILTVSAEFLFSLFLVAKIWG